MAVLFGPRGQVVRRASFGPGNIALLSDAALGALLGRIARSFPKPHAVGLGMAGLRTDADRKRVEVHCARIWRGAASRATHDLEVALSANASTRSATMASVLVLSGTGSCCYGRARDGRTAKLGGWGHLLGDKGSGYELGLRALKAAVFYMDRDGAWSALGKRLLAATHCNAPEEWIGWVQRAPKEAVAALAPEVFAAACQRDRIALDLLEGAAAALARDACACATRLAGPEAAVEFLMAGGVLLQQRSFQQRVAAELRRLRPGSMVRRCRHEGALGAAMMVRNLTAPASPQAVMKSPPEPIRARDLPATEGRHPKSGRLDRMGVAAAMRLMLAEDRRLPDALWAERRKIIALVSAVVRALRAGGRLFYVGAGTSGRLGILDASECPPTFRTKPEQVQGIIAGGHTAVFRAVEGAEDDGDAGAASVQRRGVGRRDVVLGIAASGRTPFVWGALQAAAARGAWTALLCFDARVRRRGRVPLMVLAPRIGPEVLTGSTRLKAGTATKLVLNLVTTLAMVRLGKVVGNLMVDLDPKNAKLRDRAIRIVMELAGVDAARAQAALESSGWEVKAALRALGWR